MRSGQQYLSSINDGRAVYIDGARVDDVTSHPAFRGATRSVARLYDVSSNPANADLMTTPSPYTGEPMNIAHMIPRSKEDLVRRRKGLRRWSEETYGLMGRSPDHVASFIAGFAGNASVFGRGGAQFAENIVRFHQRVCEEDLYLADGICSVQIDRSRPAHQQSDPHLYAGVKEEREDGIVPRVRRRRELPLRSRTGSTSAPSSRCALGDENYAVSLAVPVKHAGAERSIRRVRTRRPRRVPLTTRAPRALTRLDALRGVRRCVRAVGAGLRLSATVRSWPHSGWKTPRTRSAKTRRSIRSRPSSTAHSGSPTGSRT